jgi:FkbH-like protein
VIGDDGVDGIELGPLYPGKSYVEVQRVAKALREQGVILAVASKNEPDVVRDALARHPEMVLRTEDFVAVEAGWNAKDAIIRKLVETLNLGIDSVVFADDSSFETELVRTSLPKVDVVHMAGDPANLPALLLGAGRFDVLATTETDGARTEMYRTQVERSEFAVAFDDTADYLRGLDLRVKLAPADTFSLPRIIQLGLRTNQFTMVRKPHSEAVTRQLANSSEHLLLGFEVADRFGREGLVGAIWIHRGPQVWTLENFVMSCRVFSRGVETAVLAEVAAAALGAGADRLTVPFERTDRNGPAAAFLAAAGFTEPAPGADGAPRILDLSAGAPAQPDWITLERTTADV